MRPLASLRLQAPAAPRCSTNGPSQPAVRVNAAPAPRRRQQLRPQAQAAGGRQQAPPPPSAAAGTEADAGYETDNDGQTLEQRLRMVQNMVATAELLVPYDRSAVNLGLILW